MSPWYHHAERGDKQTYYNNRSKTNVYTIHQEPIIARLDELGQGQARILDEVIQSRQLSEQILRDTTRLWNLSSNNLSAEQPQSLSCAQSL